MATEPEALQPEAIVEEEPRYLRRQKPVDIRRRRLGRRGWQFYKRVLAASFAALIGGWLIYQVAHFFLYSPRVVLARPDQIEVTGNHYVSRRAVLERFIVDRGRSVLRVPLAERRQALEEIPWVEQASVERILPGRIRVELTERSPVAFLRQGTELALVDAYGVILERPAEGQFHFPVVTGLGEPVPRAARQQRMQMYVQFLKEIELVRPGASERVSEVDLTDARDLRATLAGIPGADAATGAEPSAVLIHFGDGDFVNKFRLLVENFPQWRANAGRVESIDLRFARQVVVNPESKTAAAKTAPQPETTGRAR